MADNGQQQRPTTLQLHAMDNIAVALTKLTSQTAVGIGDVKTVAPIPSGHKIALTQITANAPVRKYGQVIGFATRSIQPGEHVHTHNLAMGNFQRSYGIGADTRGGELLPESDCATFNGFIRHKGGVGTRNYIGIIPTVSCSSSVARFIANRFTPQILDAYPQVDGVVALGHSLGCCHGPDSEGLAILQRTIAGYARNPNFGGTMVIGLGCEVNQVDGLMDRTGLANSPDFKTIAIQASGGTGETVTAGVRAVTEMLPEVNGHKREPAPTSDLVLALECGGSDAFSGISANPALGAAVDLLVRNGGTAILSETPEVYGAEHLLTRRSSSMAVGQKLIDRIHWWERYTAQLGSELNNNPSPGNKAGGLTTILEKSLGAISKGGTTDLKAVYQYAERVDEPGLVFMDTPGYDVVSMTGMVAGGANLACFTTGRGTVCGFTPVPTLKLASNSPMYHHLEADMDINCGRIIDARNTVEEMGRVIFDHILAVASGRKVKSEAWDFGASEFVPWQIGAIL